MAPLPDAAHADRPETDGAGPPAILAPESVRRILVCQLRQIGDVLLATPALELLAREPLASGGRRFAVLGTMLELGQQSLELHQRVARRAAELGLDGLVVVDGGQEGAAMIEAAAPMDRLQRVDTPAEALDALAPWLSPGDALLLKASRGVALERLIPLLEARLAQPA